MIELNILYAVLQTATRGNGRVVWKLEHGKVRLDAHTDHCTSEFRATPKEAKGTGNKQGIHTNPHLIPVVVGNEHNTSLDAESLCRPEMRTIMHKPPCLRPEA